MYMNGVSIRVIGGNELPTGYVELNHQQTYKLALANKNDRLADCEVHIDGKHVGTWRIPAYQTVTIERPVHEAKLFTFFERESHEGRAAELNLVSKSDLGLIQAVFHLEKEKPRPVVTYSAIDTKFRKSTNLLSIDLNYHEYDSIGASENLSSGSEPTAATHNSGGTGLTGESRQEFTEAASVEYDPNWTTTLSLRLVSKKKPYISPLRPSSAAIPSPLH